MKDAKEIDVGLHDEGVEVWRPVEAEHLHGSVHRIASQPYDPEVESWQFVPGDEVVCELIESSERRILAATRRGIGPP